MLLQMVDGGILAIKYDSEFSNGCETCDYGSSYVSEYKIELTTGWIKIKAEQMYEYSLTEGYMMELILGNVDQIRGMTEEFFFDWMKDRVKKDAGKRTPWREVETDVTWGDK